MLDLGFLEDVEKILSLTPSSRQTALFSATMPPPIRKLADRYMYDPTIIQVEADDAHDRHRRAVPAAGGDEGQARQARRGAARRGARPGDRVRAHEDPLRSAVSHAARPRHERAGAARRHVPGLARRRDARVQGRARADPRGHRRGRARPGHLDRHPRDQLRRADQPRHLRAPHRAHRPRGALGPRDHVRGATARSASWRRSNATSARDIAQWEQGAVAAPTPVRERPRRHSKPRISRRDDHEPYVKLVLGGGRAAGLRVADIVAAVTSSAGLDGEAVRDVLVLERFSFLSVPAAEAERVIEALDGRAIGAAGPEAVSLRAREGKVGACQPPRCRPPKGRSSSSCSTRTRPRPSRTSASSPPTASTTG